MHLKTIIKSILILLISSNAFANETLIFALDIVRHGDRTPLFSIPKSNYKWIEGHGKLTAIGMQQMFQLGTHIRKKYVDDYQLLPKHYQNGTIFVSSTDYDRTLISAQSILLGLYPLGTGPILPNGTPALPEAFQAIPIHVKT
ncbi:MAG: histidine phosphatase family protein [Gammaproteobacteria bacterium]|nr:histidine phosphatase family protein [Gammaproteobacteria bacterium]